MRALFWLYVGLAVLSSTLFVYNVVTGHALLAGVWALLCAVDVTLATLERRRTRPCACHGVTA